MPSVDDRELLEVLERAFAHHAGADTVIGVEHLKRALELRSDYLARRILSLFDADGDGVVRRHEFLGAVRALVFGTDREKLAFAFRLWDHDDDGYLVREELHRMIALCLAESEVEERATQPAAALTSVFLSEADTNRDARISFDEFAAVAARYPELLARMTRSEAIWIAPNEELLLLLDERMGRRPDPDTRLLSERWRRASVVVLWVSANVAAFAWSWCLGRASDTTDLAMRLGRALGACIDLDAAFVFLPVMRRLITRLRPGWLGRIVPIDDAIDLHRLVGHTLFGLALAHGVAFFLAFSGGHDGSPLAVLTTQRGATGAALLAVFAVMWTFSLSFIRRSRRFELFYFTHLLYVVWLVLIVAHGPRVLVFSGLAIVLFVVEQALRLRRRGRPGRILSAEPLRSGVTALTLERPAGFTFDAGDYVFLRVPAVARHEWHPFTISSAPESELLTIHVRSLGNWTAALRRLAESGPGPLAAYLDGPYGSPSARIFRSRHVVLIGAGIGVTPFASVLDSAIRRSEGHPIARSSLEKVHFFWLNRDQYSFEWFRKLLARLERADARALLDVHLCMTGVRNGITAFGLELAREVMAHSGRSDFITGLRTKTHLGHPDWEALLGAIAASHRPEPVDVFFCGPHPLARRLRPICAGLGMRFHEERF